MKTKHKIVILIPCYNEEKTIKEVVLSFKRELPEAIIYVYNNNSTDNTEKEAKQAGAIVKHEYKQGKGNVVKAMFHDIEAECYLLVDGDNTYSAKQALDMCNLILTRKADMVIGDRLSTTYFKENKRPFHNFGNKLIRYIVNKLFKGNINDILSGYRAFSSEFVKNIDIKSTSFEVETELTTKSLINNIKIIEIPVDYKDRPVGSISKLHTLKDGIKIIVTIIKLRIQGE